MSEPRQENPEIAEGIPAEVSRILAKSQRVPVAAIRPDTRLESDLEVDSLATIQIFVALEEALGFSVPEEDRFRTLAIVTVEDLTEFVRGQVARQTELSR